MTDDEIKQKWLDNGESASTLGTLLHLFIEHYYNKWDLPSADIPDEYNRLFKPYDDITKKRGWIPYRSEWCVLLING